MASRLFAAWLLIQVMPQLADILGRYLAGSELNVTRPVIYFLIVLVFPIVGCIAAYIFWNKANWVSSLLAADAPSPDLPSSASGAGGQTIAWERLGLMVAGAFSVSGLLTELSRLLSEIVNYGGFNEDARHNGYMLTYIFHAVASLGLAYVFLARPESFMALVKALRRDSVRRADAD
ncbi:MAG: hypothetical protein ACTHLA_05740 [Asticcacaulis sp.]|uniref:hypothetical protein n=1 Tax=Asticcacaulis sp. TaxID=1872648 RepID=UPI003F7C900D